MRVLGGERWRIVDAQLDALQREALAIDFDPLDVPRRQFITGGRAWHMCRQGAPIPSVRHPRHEGLGVRTR